MQKIYNKPESNPRLTIDLDALHKNARHLIGMTGGGLIAVVKNDAYHFGLERAVETSVSYTHLTLPTKRIV